MPTNLKTETIKAIKLLDNPKNILPTLIETARHLLKQFPKLALSSEVLARRVKFRKAYYEKRKALHKSSSKNLSVKSDPSTLTTPSNTISDDDDLEQSFREKMELERGFARERNKQRENEARIKYLLKQLDEAERRFEAIATINESVEPIVIEPKQSSRIHESVPLAMASDWHVEENVDARSVNDLNTYNLTVAETRICNFFQNVLRLVNKERHESAINEMVLWLGGDLMSGYIHEELMESNNLSPTETVLWLKKRLVGGIDYLLQHGNLKKILIPTNYGNHGRTTEKMRISTGYKNSYEFMLYCILEDLYKERNEKRVQFCNAIGEFNFITIYDKIIRASHGYHFKYKDGVGGVTIPAMKAIAVQNRIRMADYDIWGHYHQYFTNPYFCQNGSLIGVSAYGRRFGSEMPKQGFFVVNKKRGIVSPNAIFAD